ncbi:Magnesium and cobalt efflux protein CorC [hydrothermal vent metagenome]|uniref:Magnesium and cobalt efflux protein CorC n=1 Tax=hydrothermal vent metagenome TaxID=652676 RepID=A0A3B0ZZK3_9ZZZZ
MNEERSSSPDGQADKEDKNGRSWIGRITHLLNSDPKNRDELVSVVREAQDKDIIDLDALVMIEGVLQVTEMQVRDVMIPRSQMIVLEREMSMQEVLPMVVDAAHSRYPVVGDNRDEVIGILLAKDLLPYFQLGTEDKFNLRDILRPAAFIPESKRLNVLLKEFRASRNHMAIVVDEYGGVAGMVTIEDVLEQIVGEIEDEHDFEDDIYIMEHSAAKSTVKAITPIDEFNEHFHTKVVSSEFDTIGGLVMNALGHLPKRGESTSIAGYDLKVLRADARRIHLLQVTKTIDQAQSVIEDQTDNA